MFWIELEANLLQHDFRSSGIHYVDIVYLRSRTRRVKTIWYRAISSEQAPVSFFWKWPLVLTE